MESRCRRSWSAKTWNRGLGKRRRERFTWTLAIFLLRRARVRCWEWIAISGTRAKAAAGREWTADACWRRWITSYSESAIRHTRECATTARLLALIWDPEFSGQYRRWGTRRETSRSRNSSGAPAQHGWNGMRS